MNDATAKLVQNLLDVVVNPVVDLLFTGAVFYFIWGVFKYVRNGDDPTERAVGGRHIIYGIIGLFIMVSAWGIIAILQSTILGK